MATLFVIPPKIKKTVYISLSGECLHKLWHIHSMGYVAPVKKNQDLLQVVKLNIHQDKILREQVCTCYIIDCVKNERHILL